VADDWVVAVLLGAALLTFFALLTAAAWRARAALAGTLALSGLAACVGALVASARAVLWITAPFALISGGLLALGSLSARLLGEDGNRE
jgi:hypothetical protein